MADNASASGPKSTFEAYRAEGDMLFKQQEFKKALESYDQAMELRNDDRNCLVARSRCYLQLGDTDSALKDAEGSMQDDPNFFKGMLCKADALYFKGEFEMALVFYHRGNKLRPEQHEFRLGIQKCQEAINNSVGSPEKVKLRKDGDLSYFYKPQEEEAARKKKQNHMRPGRKLGSEQKKQTRPVSGHKDKTIKQLLGSLYADREYLEKLLKEEDNRLDELSTCGKCGYKTFMCNCNAGGLVDHDHLGKYDDDEEDGFKVYSEKFKNKKIILAPEKKKKKESPWGDDEEDDKPQRNGPKRIDAKEKKTKTSQEIHNLALNGLLYLDTRTDFWRQQKPMYARKRDQELQKAKLAKKGNTDPVKFTLMKLREIDEYHTRGKYKDVIKESSRTMKLVNSWTEDELGNKKEVTASLHSSAGNAYLELGDFDNALREHQQDHDLAKSLGNDELESRAMDNLGRVYARVGKFDEAINVWEKKIAKKPDMQDLEAAWVYHELGRCYLETGKTEKAKEYGDKSYEYAQSADDEVWQLHSSVLIAQSQAKHGELEASVDSFERALDFAKLQEDREAEKAIKKALKDVNERIAKKLSDPDAVKEKETKEEGDDYNDDFADDEGGDDEDRAEESEASHQNNSGNNEPFPPLPSPKTSASPSNEPEGDKELLPQTQHGDSISNHESSDHEARRNSAEGSPNSTSSPQRKTSSGKISSEGDLNDQRVESRAEVSEHESQVDDRPSSSALASKPHKPSSTALKSPQTSQLSMVEQSSKALKSDAPMGTATAGSHPGSSASMRSTHSKKVKSGDSLRSSAASVRSSESKRSVPLASSRTPSLRSLRSTGAVTQPQSPGKVSQTGSRSKAGSLASLRSTKGKKTPSQTSLQSKTPSRSSLKSSPEKAVPSQSITKDSEDEKADISQHDAKTINQSDTSGRKASKGARAKDQGSKASIQSDAVSDSFRFDTKSMSENAGMSQGVPKDEASQSVPNQESSRESTPAVASNTSLKSQEGEGDAEVKDGKPPDQHKK